MKLLPPLSKFSIKQWALIFSGILWAVLTWQFHFILEFSVIIKHGLPFYFVAFHYLGVLIGGFISLCIPPKKLFAPFYILAMAISVFFYVSLLVFFEGWFIPIGLFGGGIGIGLSIGYVGEQMVVVFDDPKFSGRLYAIGFIGIALFIVVEGLLDIYVNPWLGVIYLSILFILLFISILIGKSAEGMNSQKPYKLRKFLQKDNIPMVLFAFFYGFFFINTYYAAILILERNNSLSNLNNFVIVLFLSVGLSSLASGFIADILGRRLTILIGFTLQALAFMILSFMSQIDIVLLFIFPIIIGSGFTMSLANGLLVMTETPEKHHIRRYLTYFFIFMVPGMLSGVLIAEILKPIILDEPAYLTIILLFMFVLAMLIIFQLKETLPSKEELEWKSSIQYLYVIQKSGVAIFMQKLSDLPVSKQDTHGDLLSGVLTAISSILKEIAENESPLKVVKQEGFSILIEEGEKVLVAVIALKELRIIRHKMEDFLEDFQDYFVELIDMEGADVRVFSPAKKLVEKHFS